MNNFSGNKNTSATLKDVLDALKRNIMRTCNVAEIVKVEQEKDSKGNFLCSMLTNSESKFDCIALQDLDVKVNDLMLCIFTNTNFFSNLQKYKNGQKLVTVKSSELHSKNYGVLIGLIYRKTEE